MQRASGSTAGAGPLSRAQLLDLVLHQKCLQGLKQIFRFREPKPRSLGPCDDRSRSKPASSTRSVVPSGRAASSQMVNGGKSSEGMRHWQPYLAMKKIALIDAQPGSPPCFGRDMTVASIVEVRGSGSGHYSLVGN